MSAAVLPKRSPAVAGLLLRYTQALIAQMAQTEVCNRHNAVDQQLCRWLLLSLDRLSGNELVVTQELISQLLVVRRKGVTEDALSLQLAGLITCKRGHMVLDRNGLEQRSCECYRSAGQGWVRGIGDGAGAVHPQADAQQLGSAAEKGELHGAGNRPVSAEQMKLARLRADLARVKMERDILRTATAQFAQESL